MIINNVELIEKIEKLTGVNVDFLEQNEKSGGNNRLFKLVQNGKEFALKFYLPQKNDKRDRIGTEFRFLSFLYENGIREIPKPILSSPSNFFAIYEWIEGSSPVLSSEKNIIKMANFFVSLQKSKDNDKPPYLPPTPAACFNVSAAFDQLEGRLARLNSQKEKHTNLKVFLETKFLPVQTKVLNNIYAQNLDLNVVISQNQKVLSPSDFGFHNMIMKNDGSIFFIDFEYAGYDDPVKTISDIFFHAGMNLTHDLKKLFAQKCLDYLKKNDAEIIKRLALLCPVYGLIWALIVLNEFLPEVWERRRFAGNNKSHDEILSFQLDKAQKIIDDLGNYNDEFFYSCGADKTR